MAVIVAVLALEGVGRVFVVVAITAIAGLVVNAVALRFRLEDRARNRGTGALKNALSAIRRLTTTQRQLPMRRQNDASPVIVDEDYCRVRG
jgi:hypothetical protein